MKKNQRYRFKCLGALITSCKSISFKMHERKKKSSKLLFYSTAATALLLYSIKRLQSMLNLTLKTLFVNNLLEYFLSHLFSFLFSTNIHKTMIAN